MYRRSEHLRAFLGWTALLSWIGGVVALVSIYLFGLHYQLRPALLMVLAVAVTCTITYVVGGALSPIEDIFDVGYSAGWDDRDKQGRRVLVEMPKPINLDRRLTDRLGRPNAS